MSQDPALPGSRQRVDPDETVLGGVTHESLTPIKDAARASDEGGPKKGLLTENDSEIRLVPDGVRDVWNRRRGESTLTDRERQSWAEFLKSPEGKKWLRERTR